MRPDKPSTQKSSTAKPRKKKAAPAKQSPINTSESSPEALIPEVLSAQLTQHPIDDAERARWISVRAYELAQGRGFAPGRELDDWLQAEREFYARQSHPARPEDQFTG